MIISETERYTYADILTDDSLERVELHDGVPYALAAPTLVHQFISGEIYEQIKAKIGDGRCRVFYAPIDVRLFACADDTPSSVDTVVQPDLIVVCDRSKLDLRGVHGAPDLIIEILSDSTRQNDRIVKYMLYEQAGVREYWIVDPEQQIVLVHTLNGNRYHAPVAYGANSTVPVGILEECAVDLKKVFPHSGIFE